jgi:hypothetical protein
MEETNKSEELGFINIQVKPSGEFAFYSNIDEEDTCCNILLDVVKTLIHKKKEQSNIVIPELRAVK